MAASTHLSNLTTDKLDDDKRASYNLDTMLEPNFKVAESVLKDLVSSELATSYFIEKKVREFCQLYRSFSDDQKGALLVTLCRNFGLEHKKVMSAAENLLQEKEDNIMALLRLEERLKDLLSPKYNWIFAQIGKIDGGVKFLVDMRADLLCSISREDGGIDLLPSMRSMNNALRDLLVLWFSVGFLNLEIITWKSPCEMLEKISEYEAVHPIRNWTDLKRRVGAYRRCFVFTHNAMPSEPIVILHVALTDNIPSSMREIVQTPKMMSVDSVMSSTGFKPEEDVRSSNSAIFYSITSTQKGLQGIELGTYLIKRVVHEIQQEMPNVKVFSTLSPIPGFKMWLISQIKEAEKGCCRVFTEEEQVNLVEHFGPPDRFYCSFRYMLGNGSWIQDDSLVQILEIPLMRMCAQYLFLEKRRGLALDSVANFHLRNGAVMWRINWKADLSPRGLGNSCGIMVNYRYFLEDCDENSSKYLRKRTIATSEQVEHLANESVQVKTSSKL
ncbi:malonyl-CoA decarboxylase, mitochondrial-like isoform X2 [Artemia franciscana]|nr:hypothetical protein QYM36_010208 [Artemia franciscana]KAK2715543.1 hypothetical protein QYM36_010208 [Artemia franciscana]KAK2715544.1 hypothetical protein QYM36_010208 [Artemia franciscana]